MPGNYPEESTQHSEHGESLKSRIQNLSEYKRQDESSASYFFSDTITTLVTKFTHIMGTSFTKLRLLLHKVPFIINKLYPPLHEMLYAGHIQLFAEALWCLSPIFFSLLSE